MKVLSKNNIISLCILCFFSALIIAALHHHDNSFRLITCSLCKISSSVSIASKKENPDTHFAPPSNYLLLAAIPPAVSERIITGSAIIHFSTALHSLFNKAPPFQS
jgi:hypothetical protein